ncbi:MAG: hypothetical protein ABJB85_10250 [Nitrososphaerota archaeon]
MTTESYHHFLQSRVDDTRNVSVPHYGKTGAEDIYQLMSQFNKISLAAHVVGAQTAFSYTAIIQKM